MTTFLYLCHLNVVGFRVIFICSADQQSEKRIKLLAAVSVYGTTNGPNHGKDKQALKPVCDLQSEGY